MIGFFFIQSSCFANPLFMSHITKVPEIPEVEKKTQKQDKIPTFELESKSCPIKSGKEKKKKKIKNFFKK